MSDQLGPVFAALADPTRRRMLDAMLLQGSTSVPDLTADLPISRQAIAKHMATLGQARLVQRVDRQPAGREVRYQLRPGALHEASAWLAQADAAWEQRLGRLKQVVEGKVEG